MRPIKCLLNRWPQLVWLTSWSDELYIVSEEQMIAGQFIWQVIYKNQEQKGPMRRALRHTEKGHTLRHTA